MLNGCSFCLDLHTRNARNLGETERRIYLLGAWREANLYTEQERAGLAPRWRAGNGTQPTRLARCAPGSRASNYRPAGLTSGADLGRSSQRRPKDEIYFAVTLPLLSQSQRQWLGDALTLAYEPDHAWFTRLHNPQSSTCQKQRRPLR
jgi:Carboxymuconolactone decarboxylase family